MSRNIRSLPRMSAFYEDIVPLFVPLYRFFTYVLAVLLIQVIPLDSSTEPGFRTYLILGLAGVYTLTKVFSPFIWRQKHPATYVVLGIDVIACMAPMMFTGGLDSGFLLYALTPVIAACLFFGERTAYFTAGILVFLVLLAHAGLSHWTAEFAWIMQGSHLLQALIYCVFCILIVSLTPRINMNARQLIQTKAAVAERMRIRRELHDGVAQELGYLRMKTKSVGELVSCGDTQGAILGLDEIQTVLRNAYADIRWSVDSLSDTRDLPVVEVFGDHVREFAERHGLEAELQLPQDPPELSRAAELQLLRIFHEALNNVRKHAQASKVVVKLDNSSEGVNMLIKDNGRGFSPQRNGHHHGLIIMKERAESIGGTCDVVSSPNEGTEVRVTVPVKKVRW